MNLHSIDPTLASTADYQDAMWLAIMAAYPEHQRPRVPVIRVISDDAFGNYFSSCMAGENFPVTVLKDNSFQADRELGESEDFSLAMFSCEASYPRPFILGRFMPVERFSDDQAAELYSYYRDQLVPCLAEAGYPAGPLPSEDVYVLEINTARRYLPYSSTVMGLGLTEEAWMQLNSTCPQQPPSWTDQG